MQTLASFFVSLVVVANSFFPNSNLTQVLGIETSHSSSTSGELHLNLEHPNTSSASGAEVKNLLEKLKTLIKGDTTLPHKDSSESAERKAEFETKVAEIKDARKKETVTKIETNLSSVNSKAVENWNKVLDRLTQILNKIQTRTDEAATSGKDVSAVNAAITLAAGKIADAKTAVDAQSAKTYVIDIGSEATLGTNAKTTISSMKTDLKAVEVKVKDAIQSVKDVLATLTTP